MIQAARWDSEERTKPSVLGAMVSEGAGKVTPHGTIEIVLLLQRTVRT